MTQADKRKSPAHWSVLIQIRLQMFKSVDHAARKIRNLLCIAVNPGQPVHPAPRPDAYVLPGLRAPVYVLPWTSGRYRQR